MNATVCIVEDDNAYRQALSGLLIRNGYKTIEFSTAEDFLAQFESIRSSIDLIISDLTMKNVSGYDLCKSIRSMHLDEYIPIIVVTGFHADDQKIEGIEAGADDFISKPFNSKELLAKIKSLLSLRSSQMETLHQLTQTRGEKESLVGELQTKSQSLTQLKKFVSPNVADLLTTTDPASLLKRRQRDVTVIFVDLRGFTTFSEKFPPHDVMTVLESYYTAVGECTFRYNGTIGHLAGDGIMVFFNDPLALPNHPVEGARAALEIRNSLLSLVSDWNKNQYNLDFGIGLARGEATIGGIGFEHFWQYTVIGNVTNLASRLCQIAQGGEILLPQSFYDLVSSEFSMAAMGQQHIKGLGHPVDLFRLLEVKRDRSTA